MAENAEASAGNTSFDDQDIVTLGEVIQSEKQMYEDACAVLGASDDSNCTYTSGYLKRQALYACLSCIPEAKTDETKRAGVCLACCLQCHDGHELIELYTKRNFRCDCGNSKFPHQHCNLYNEKDELNELNEYNQNFSGVYCLCHRPYPDPEDKVSDEMIQCIVCEDWYHTRHLGVALPEISYAEMTCEGCVERLEFLRCYDHLTTSAKETGSENAKVDVEALEPTAGKKPEEKVAETTNTAETSENDNKTDKVEGMVEEKSVGEKPAADKSTESVPPTETAQNKILCKLPEDRPLDSETKFWRNVNWREELCRCTNCMQLYSDEKILFLLESGDTVQSYEEKGKAIAVEIEKDMLKEETKLLNSMDRVPLLNAIEGYNDLRTNLMDYLKTFAENKKVVREEDIREFFAEMSEKKRQKTENGYLPR